MSFQDSLNKVLASNDPLDPTAGTGEATQQNSRRAAAIQEDVRGASSFQSALNEVLQSESTAQPAAPASAPASARPAAIPTATETPQKVGLGEAISREFEYLGSSLKRGWNTVATAVAGSNLNTLAQLERDAFRFKSDEDFARDPELRASRDKLRARMLETAQYIRDVSKENEALLSSDSTRPETKQLYGVGKGERGWIETAKDVGSAIISNPMSVVDLGLGSAPASLASAASAVAVTLATKSPLAAAAAGGGVSGYVEFGNEYAQQRESGLSHEEAWSKAARKSGVVGLLDGISMGTAGKALDTIIDATVGTVARTAVKETIKETARQGALGAAGEAGGSLLAGEPVSPTNVILEAIGETVTAPIEAVSTARGIVGETAAAEARQTDVARQAAVRALDPNRDVAIDPAVTTRPAGSTVTSPVDQQPLTAVKQAESPPESPPEDPQAQNLSQPDSPTTTVDQVLNQSGADLLDELDAQEAAQATAVQQPVVDPTFTSAVEGIKADLGLDATENLNLGLVTDNTRLNRFKNALETSFGVKVHFVDFGEQLTTDSGKQLGAFNGYRQGDTILIGANGVDLIDTTWHELTHVLETRHSDVYAQLRDTLVPAMDATVRDQLISSLNARRQAEVGRDLSQQELDSELVAYVVGDLVRSPETMGQMFDSFSDPVAAKTFRDVVMDALQKMLAVIKGPQYIRERARLVEAQKSVTAAFAEFQKRETQKRMAAAPVQPAAQPAPARQAASASTPASAANSELMVKSIADFVRGKPAKTRKLPSGETVVSLPFASIGGRGFAPDITLPSGKDDTVDNITAQALVQLRAEYDKEGRAFPSDPAQMSRDEFALAYEAGAIPEFEIDADEIGTVVEDRGDGFRVNVDKLYDKIQKQAAPAAPTTAVAQPGQFARRTKLQIATRLSEGKPVTDSEMSRNPELAAVRDGVRELIKRAPAVKAKFDNRAKRLAKKHGMKLLAGPIKSEHRAFGKAWFDKGGDFRGLNDIVRSTFVVKDLNDIPAMVDVVLAEFPGSRVRRNGWVNPSDVGETGYRDVFFENVTFDGFRVELQMNLQPMIDAKQSQGHKLYEEETSLTRQLDNPGLSAEQRAEIQAKRADNIARQNAVYSKGYQAVLAATKSLNSASDTRLPSESTREAETGRGGPTPDVEGPSQAMNPSSGARETGMPSTLKNDVPSGNDLGNDIVRTPAIPDGNIAQQQAEQNRFRLGIQRAARVTDAEAGLSPDELTAIQTDATKKGVPDDVLRRLVEDAVAAKRRFPVAQGWAPMFVRGVLVPEGATPADAELNWTPIPYKYNVPDGVGRAPQKLNEAWADKVSEEFYKLIKGVYGRAIAGDRNANVILSHKNWYRNVTEVLRREFGATGDLLADLLGATSPNTPVDTNWQFSVDILRRFVRGDFNEDLKKFAQYVADGGRVSDYPSEEKIRQISGKLYGMNSSNAMLALLNTWRQIHPGQAPKARNFALNLIGQSNMATIDVWAARMLRRAANIAAGGNALARVPPPAEQGVTGNWNSKATAVTGEFGFGARVMDTVVERLRAEGIDVTAPDLQAIAWFTEKELWSKNNWTSAQGEGGSFEENIEGMPMERYLAGWSIQQGEVVPEEGASSMAQARVMTALKMDGSVIAARVMPTKGLYGGTVEQSFDTEWTAEKGKHDPSLVLAEISQIAKDNSQYDIFVSKVLKPDEASDNARPGVEIYFRDQGALDAAMPVLERFTSQGVDGFTMAVDPRAEGGNYIGVRLQYIPEISMRWDEEFRASALTDGFIEDALQQKRQQLNDITAEVSQMDGVAFAKTYQYDTIVVGKENYDAFIDRATAGGDRQTRNEVWFGEPIRSAVERAAARLNRDSGQVDAGRVQDASRPAPESVGQFSRQLVELAANQDPRAPKLFGISETPNVLRAVGGPRQLLVIEPRTVAKIVNPQFTGRVTEEGGMRRNAAGLMVPAAARIPLTVDELRSVPAMIADPVAVIRSEGGTMTRRYGYKVILDMVKNGNPVVAIVHPDVRYGNDKASEIASVYPVNEGNSLAETNRELNGAQLLYFNKGKATVLASKIGSKLSSITKITPPLAKNPGSVPNRTLPPIKGSNFSRRVPLMGQRFELPAYSTGEELSNRLVNRMARVSRVQDAVVAQGGTMDIRDAQGNVIGSTDVTSATEAMSNSTASRIEDFRDNTIIPLINDAASMSVNLEEVAQYLYALYAPERNAVIQQRNPTQFATDGGSGMTNAEASDIVLRFRLRPDFPQIAQIAERFKGITRMTQNVLLSEGLVEPAVMAQWRADNPNYVPLSGFEEVNEQTGERLGGDTPGRTDPRNPFVKTAKGRKSRAGDILENVIKQYEDAVVLAGRNNVYRLLLNFIRQNPDQNLWQVNAPRQRRTYRKGTLTLTGQTQGQVSVSYDVEDSPSNTIAVRIQGRPVFIKINDPQMLAELQMQGVQLDEGSMKKMLDAKRSMMQFLAKTYTAINPAFTFAELFRSLEQMFMFNTIKYGSGDAGRAFKKLMRASKAAYKAQRNNSWAGNQDTITIREPNGTTRNVSTKEAWEMFKADGGKTAFYDIRNVDDIRDEIQRRFSLAQAASTSDPRAFPKRMLNAVLSVEEAIVEFASTTDNIYRFATYMARLEAGKTRQEAADAARNVTVNFAQRGTWTPYLGMFYMFFKPAVQGAKNTANLAFRSGWRGNVAIGSMITLGYLIAAASMMNIGDDDEPYWDKDLYKQAKLRNIPLFNEDGDMVLVPLAYGWGFFVNLGYALHDLQRGQPIAKAGAFLRDSFFTHFSPLGSFENPATFFAPTMLDPVLVLSQNKTDQGLPLRPDYPWDPDMPNSEKYWAATRGTGLQQLSRKLNEASGGTPYYSGWLDISPEDMRYMIGFLTGGAGGFVRDASEAIYLSTEIDVGTALEKNKIPILKRFYVQNTGKQDQVAFNQNASEAISALRQWKQESDSDYMLREDVQERLDRNEGIAGLAKAAQRIRAAVSVLRKQEIDIVEQRSSGDITAADAEQMLKEISDQKRDLYIEFNREFYRESPNKPD